MGKKLRAHSRDLSFETRGEQYATVEEALAVAAVNALAERNTTSVFVYAHTAKGAMKWGGEEAVREFDNHNRTDESLAVIYVTAKASYY